MRLQDPSVVVEEHCELQSKENMLFAATAIANGSGVAVVNSIGMATEIGKIQSQIQEAAKQEDDTPLKKKLDEFGEALAKVRKRCEAAPVCVRGLTLRADATIIGCCH
jgi:Ca2+-transporting ATPase